MGNEQDDAIRTANRDEEIRRYCEIRKQEFYGEWADPAFVFERVEEWKRVLSAGGSIGEEAEEAIAAEHKRNMDARRERGRRRSEYEGEG